MIDYEAPVVVSAVGGSGTRVVCQILQQLGFHMGITRTGSQDTIWFPDLLGWPDLFATPAQLESPSAETESQISRRLDLFEELMFSQFFGVAHTAYVRSKWLWYRATRLNPVYPERMRLSTRLNLGSLTDLSAWANLEQSSFLGWGWKEPISHFYLPQLCQRYPGMRYIYVMRHGLDMALTDNRWQYEVWAPLLGLPVMPTPARLVEFWAIVTRRVREFASENLEGRFLVIRFEDLVFETSETLRAIGRFLGVELDHASLAELSGLVEQPKSIGRSRGLDLSQISQADIDEITSFGYHCADDEPLLPKRTGD